MTSNVKCSAHCANNKRLQVLVNGTVVATLKDGETYDTSVYDDRVVSTKEVDVADLPAEPIVDQLPLGEAVAEESKADGADASADSVEESKEG